MALWARTRMLTGNYLRQVQELYSGRYGSFPMEVRDSIAPWIEMQDWKSVEDNGDETVALHLLNQMEIQVTEYANRFITDEQGFAYRMRLLESANSIKMSFKDNPLAFIGFIRESLIREEQLVMMSCGEPMKQEHQVSQTERRILSDMEALRNRVMETGTNVREMQQRQEFFVLQYQRNKRNEDTMNELRKGSLKLQKEEAMKSLQKEITDAQPDLKARAMELHQIRMRTYELLKGIIVQFKTLSQMVFEVELVNWKNLQKQSTYKANLCDAHVLMKIQRWCEEFAGLLNDCKQQVMKLQMLEEEIHSKKEDKMVISELDMELRALLNVLLLNSFVIDRQPPQVVRKDARFTATVRLLVGDKLNVFMSMPTVQASIISEPQARRIAAEKCLPEAMENAGDILNNKGTMEYSQGQMSVTFRNMQLKRIKRADRKGQELVAEEKFCILFHAKIQANIKYETWTMSLPIVVTVHGNQECQAQATILWDNAFSSPGRVPFVVPDHVKWSELSSLLSSWFHLKTGKGLSFEQMHYIGAKLFGDSSADFSNNVVTRSQFHKENPGQYHSPLWEWFYLVQKLTREHFKEPWVDDLILGFVSKPMAHDLLLTAPLGTFLLRFSDSELGGISIVYKCLKPGTVDDIAVCNIKPFTDKDFRVRSLADRIKDIKFLQYLYPQIPKETAFGKYWSSSAEDMTLPGEYQQHVLITQICNAPNPPSQQLPHAASPMNPQPMGIDMDYELHGDEDVLASFLNEDFEGF
ncbi:signal transducer and activator of transcription 5A-like [Watersipora subatra]|uniref:signal transducer and activator of transcription 5A-like n=1 Tax=Watersipora subatra TaxID=2589382 RepID=UPI00355BAF49